LTFKFSVDGVPVPQGSMRVFNGHIVHNKAKELMAWRAMIVEAAQNLTPHNGPISITMHFRVRRPKTVKRDMPTVAPDLDKYVRNVGDALTGIAFIDDAQIVEIVATKKYADIPGVDIEIKHL